MCKIVRKFICIIIIFVALFIGIAIWGNGGDKFRWIGEKTGGVIKKGADKLGEKADMIKEKIETTKEKAETIREKTKTIREEIEKWTGKEEDKGKE